MPSLWPWSPLDAIHGCDSTAFLFSVYLHTYLGYLGVPPRNCLLVIAKLVIIAKVLAKLVIHKYACKIRQKPSVFTNALAWR